MTLINSFTTNPLPIIYQSGYLMISDYDDRFSEFTLDYPNAEVKEGFLNGLLPLILGDSQTTEFNVAQSTTARSGIMDYERMQKQFI